MPSREHGGRILGHVLAEDAPTAEERAELDRALGDASPAGHHLPRRPVTRRGALELRLTRCGWTIERADRVSARDY